MNNLSHGVDYNKFAYNVAFLRQFYTISEQKEKTKQQHQQQHQQQQQNGQIGESDELETSTNRRWKTAMTKLGKKKRASSRPVNASERQDRR